MQTIGVLLLAAATAGDGFGYSKPGVHLKKWLRPHAVVSDGMPPGGPQYTAATMGGQGGMDMGAAGRRFVNTKSQIYFLDPDGMNIGWQTSTGPNGERSYLSTQLVVPARYNFRQGYVYRLRLSNIAGRPGVTLYPTIEVAPTTPATDAYLSHNAIPVQFTAEDFDQVVDGGNFVTKVIYLPDPKYQELAVSGVETLVSTRLEPGVDPILEADKRGTILLIVRLGAIDLEMPGAPISGAVPGGPPVSSPAPASTMVPPASLPPGVTPNPPAAGSAPVESVPVDTAPATVAPGTAPETAPAPGTPPAAAPAPGTPPTAAQPAAPATSTPPTEPTPAPEPPQN
jgi:hypothetical protein